MPSPTLPRIPLIASLCLALAGCAGGVTPPTATPTPTPTPTVSDAALITIDTPAEGATVSTPIKLSGTANTFEAALTVDVVDDSGATLCTRDVQATSGSGTPGTWEAVLAVAPPDSDTQVTLRAYSHSAADGSVENLVERSVSLTMEHPAIFFTMPACGATFAGGDTIPIEGRAFVFEAALTVELRDSSGTAVVTEHVVAAAGDQESDWSAALELPTTLTAGTYELVAYDESAKDGSIENEFAIQVFVGS